MVVIIILNLLVIASLISLFLSHILPSASEFVLASEDPATKVLNGLANKFQWDKYETFEVIYNIMKSGVLLGINNRQSKDNLNYLVNKVLKQNIYLLIHKEA